MKFFKRHLAEKRPLIKDESTEAKIGVAVFFALLPAVLAVYVGVWGVFGLVLRWALRQFGF